MRYLWLVAVLLAASCTTFSDLEREHPFGDCPDECTTGSDGACVCPDGGCPEGTEQLANGECVVPEQVNNDTSNTPNNSNTNNETTNNTDPPQNMEPCTEDDPMCCEAGTDGQCCETSDGNRMCCDEASGECCVNGPDDPNCEPPPANNSDNMWDDYVLVIADADVNEPCEEEGRNGADIFHVSIRPGNGEPLPLYVALFLGGPGSSTQDRAAAVVENGSPDQAEFECPEGDSFQLGCGGVVALGVDGNAGFDPTQNWLLRVAESGPQCDDRNDTYAVLACPWQAVQSGDEDQCMTLLEGVQGSIEEDVRP